MSNDASERQHAIRMLLPRSLLLLIGVSTSWGNSRGIPLYQAAASEITAYARMIMLQHSGSANGQYLATFEHWYAEGRNVPVVIRHSPDGLSWSTLAEIYDPEGNDAVYQPALLELPNPSAGQPAGTLLLVFNSVKNPKLRFETWRSNDHGLHWIFLNTFETSVQGQGGVWEPFLYLDATGNIVCVFSDERKSPQRSQYIGGVVSTDGGVTWGSEIDVMVGASTDRPGMAVVARIGSGPYVLAAEVCGPRKCAVHVKTSSDGITWGDGLGDPVETDDGRAAYNSPYIVWSPVGGEHGTLILSSMCERMASGDLGPENLQTMFMNTNGGTGKWSWAGAPYNPVLPPGFTRPNYSPGLLVSSNGGSVWQISTTGGGPNGIQVVADHENLAQLPYFAPFDHSSDAGWINYGGTWQVKSGTYMVNGPGSAKAIAGSTGWRDYVLTGGIRLDSSREVGFLVRASNVSLSADKLNAYLITLDRDRHVASLSRMGSARRELRSVAFKGKLAAGQWYAFSIRVQANTIRVSVLNQGSAERVDFTVKDRAFSAVAIGLWESGGSASWRQIAVNPNIYH